MYHVLLRKRKNLKDDILISKHRKKENALKSVQKNKNHPLLKEGFYLTIDEYLPRKSRQRSNQRKKQKSTGAAPDLARLFDKIFNG
tara:strand:- start:2142 stop:2399 length:258 start_codon:yes stop_codon:yes gene_type:complete